MLEFIKKKISFTEDGAIECPECGENYLHHTWVREYYRDGEDGPTTATELLNAKTRNVAFDVERNPSFRRDGLRVALFCECCDAHIELVIAQHKGCTEIYTEHLPNAHTFKRTIEGSHE